MSDPQPLIGPLTVQTEVIVVTMSSIWTLRPDTYRREPRHGERPLTQSVDDALVDSTWHHHEGIWFWPDLNALRILPAGRPAGAHGIHTGWIVSVTGS